MRHLTRLVIVASLLIAGPAAGVAGAVTTRDLVALSRAGLSDELLVALLQSDASVFHLSAADVLSLRREGLSERLIIAMLQTSRPVRQPAIVAAAPDVDGGRAGLEPGGTEAEAPIAPAPVVVNVRQDATQRVEQAPTPERTVYVPVAIAVPMVVRRAPAPQPAAPAYWGWGGQPRPGSWQAPDANRPDDGRKDVKRIDKPGGGS